jgi:hypothetical protein
VVVVVVCVPYTEVLCLRQFGIAASDLHTLAAVVASSLESPEVELIVRGGLLEALISAVAISDVEVSCIFDLHRHYVVVSTPSRMIPHCPRVCATSVRTRTHHGEHGHRRTRWGIERSSEGTGGLLRSELDIPVGVGGAMAASYAVRDWSERVFEMCIGWMNGTSHA